MYDLCGDALGRPGRLFEDQTNKILVRASIFVHDWVFVRGTKRHEKLLTYLPTNEILTGDLVLFFEHSCARKWRNAIEFLRYGVEICL